MNKQKKNNDSEIITIKVHKNLIDEVLEISGKKNASRFVEGLLKEEIELQKKFEEIKKNQ